SHRPAARRESSARAAAAARERLPVRSGDARRAINDRRARAEARAAEPVRGAEHAGGPSCEAWACRVWLRDFAASPAAHRDRESAPPARLAGGVGGGCEAA